MFNQFQFRDAVIDFRQARLLHHNRATAMFASVKSITMAALAQLLSFTAFLRRGCVTFHSSSVSLSNDT